MWPTRPGDRCGHEKVRSWVHHLRQTYVGATGPGRRWPPPRTHLEPESAARPAVRRGGPTEEGAAVAEADHSNRCRGADETAVTSGDLDVAESAVIGVPEEGQRSG